jgi:hypothetical protein
MSSPRESRSQAAVVARERAFGECAIGREKLASAAAIA